MLKKQVYEHCDSKRFVYWLRRQLDLNNIRRVDIRTAGEEETFITEEVPGDQIEIPDLDTLQREGDEMILL